ncbi:DUF4929 family protein [Alistipes megaguti]|uniref:DUF4929 family protein n=1 Tax=Alistipes megaguti TaxID=2364787 RepID=UPI00235390BA|nr:DUF4929 family protein [Alistipes megaguti]
MKKVCFWGGVLLTAAVAMTSCNEEKATGYSGTNKIYLTATDNNAVIMESDATPLEVEVSLTSSVETTTTLTFRLEDDTQELLRLEGNPVTIAAGEKSATFQVVSNVKNLLTESTYITVGIDAAQLPAGMELAEALRIRVNPNPAVPELTEEQKALIDGYKEKFGIDLNEFLGVMKCTTTLNIPGNGTTNEFSTPKTEEIPGQTVITLSEESTADMPVLKMVDNPMGLTEYLYWVFRQNTVDDDEIWTQQGEESANQRLMDRIGWTATSEETFNVTLDGIRCKNLSATGADLEILGPKEDSYGDTYMVVPFDYSFTAWDRQKELLDKGDADMQEIYDQGGFANPTFYLFYCGADTNEWEGENWLESKGHIDFEKGEMTFQFVIDHAYAGDYTRVHVTYTK